MYFSDVARQASQAKSLYRVIGLFLLLGIVKKNGILVVDFALQRIDEGWTCVRPFTKRAWNAFARS
jgi:multidrug efflux pump subunit AcrB